MLTIHKKKIFTGCGASEVTHISNSNLHAVFLSFYEHRYFGSTSKVRHHVFI